MAPDDLWPSWKIINIYIFGKSPSHTTPVPSFKFLSSVVSEKSAMLQFVGLFSPLTIAPYDLWPLQEVIKLSIFRKPSLHITTEVSFKFLCSTEPEKNAMFQFFGVSHLLWPLMTMTFARGIQTLPFWKGLMTYYHQANFQGSVIYSPWEKSNVKVLVHTDAGQIPTHFIRTQTHLASQGHQKLKLLLLYNS